MAFHQNQLQFNTGAPTYTENLSYRHHRPGAIVIEKSSGQQAFSAFPSRQNASYVTRGNGIGNKITQSIFLKMKMPVTISQLQICVIFYRIIIVAQFSALHADCTLPSYSTFTVLVQVNI